MTFLESIFARLEQRSNSPVLCEIRDGQIVPATGGEILALIRRARAFLAARGLQRGDRCALLAPNSIRWAALDFAMMAEGLIVVPLYARQAPAELAGMIRDSTPSLIFCSDAALAIEVRKHYPAAPEIVPFDRVFGGSDASNAPPYHHLDHDAVTIIYTSGTSGEPKGVVLNAGNVNHMLRCTTARLDELMGARQQPDRIFHYPPFCFAASWILLLSAFSRTSVLMLSMDLAKLPDELKIAAPDYFLNVPALLERVRSKIEDALHKKGGWALAVFTGAKREYMRRREGDSKSTITDSLCLGVANALMFPKIRKNIGPNLEALICGSAPLAVETQLFFMMLGIPVLQVYGLTETTAICTMDDPHWPEPGRVGPAIPGAEMIVSDSGEILVRGPNIFPGYWHRPAETAKALEGGWFHTGDQGEADARGNWRITGRLKNLIILNSGHNIAPEPLEQALAARLPEAQQIVLLGNQRSFLAALVSIAAANGASNGVNPGRIQSAVDALNSALPHYKQIRAFHIVPEPFTVENGLLTTMGKIKRDAVSTRFAVEIESLYEKKPA